MDRLLEAHLAGGWERRFVRRPTAAGKMASAAYDALAKIKFVPTEAQLRVPCEEMASAPELDLFGYTKVREARHDTIVELKCGNSAFSSGQQVGKATTFSTLHGPFGEWADTWRNRAMAQLALQCICVQYSTGHRPRGVLLMVSSDGVSKVAMVKDGLCNAIMACLDGGSVVVPKRKKTRKRKRSASVKK